MPLHHCPAVTCSQHLSLQDTLHPDHHAEQLTSNAVLPAVVTSGQTLNRYVMHRPTMLGTPIMVCVCVTCVLHADFKQVLGQRGSKGPAPLSKLTAHQAQIVKALIEAHADDVEVRLTVSQSWAICIFQAFF